MKAGIVGCGIMGKLLALTLVNAGWQVSLFDKDDNTELKNCSMAAAGLLTPTAELEHANPIIFHLGVDALNNHWPGILTQLQELVFFQKLGSLVFAHAQDKNELTRFLDVILSKINDTDLARKLGRAEIQDLEPDIVKFDEGYYLPSEGQIDNQSLLAALHTVLNTKDVSWFKNTRVESIKPHKVVLANTTYDFDMVFDCRGLGGRLQFADIRGVRGELIWLHTRDIHIQRPIRLLHPRYKLYLAPRPHHIYILGASEIESEDFSSISVRTLLELLSAGYCLHPGFAEARIIKTVTHCRPTLADHLPKIKFTKGFIAVNGLYRHGFLIAPSLANDILRFINQDVSSVQYPDIWEEINDQHTFQ